MENSQLAEMEDCDFTVVVTLQILAESVRKAALYAFHNLRDRLRRRPHLEFDGSDEGYLGYAALRAESVAIRATNSQAEAIVFSSSLDCNQALSDTRRFEVSLELSVSAENCTEAVQYAIDDLAADELESWNVQVTQTLTSGASHRHTIKLSRGRDY
jgi:hypothetical protein